MTRIITRSPDTLERRDQLVDAYQQTWEAPHWDTVTMETAEQEIDTVLEHDTDIMLAIDRRVVGFAFLYPLRQRDAALPDDDAFTARVDIREAGYLHSLGVAPDHRGQGVGTKMMEAVLTAADDRFQQVVLRVPPAATVATHLYTTHGFRPLGCTDPAKPDRILYLRNLPT